MVDDKYQLNTVKSTLMQHVVNPPSPNAQLRRRPIKVVVGCNMSMVNYAFPKVDNIVLVHSGPNGSPPLDKHSTNFSKLYKNYSVDMIGYAIDVSKHYRDWSFKNNNWTSTNTMVNGLRLADRKIPPTIAPDNFALGVSLVECDYNDLMRFATYLESCNFEDRSMLRCNIGESMDSPYMSTTTIISYGTPTFNIHSYPASRLRIHDIYLTKITDLCRKVVSVKRETLTADISMIHPRLDLLSGDEIEFARFRNMPRYATDGPSIYDVRDMTDTHFHIYNSNAYFGEILPGSSDTLATFIRSIFDMDCTPVIHVDAIAKLSNCVQQLIGMGFQPTAYVMEKCKFPSKHESAIYHVNLKEVPLNCETPVSTEILETGVPKFPSCRNNVVTLLFDITEQVYFPKHWHLAPDRMSFF
jgi:hypothetical protein